MAHFSGRPLSSIGLDAYVKDQKVTPIGGSAANGKQFGEDVIQHRDAASYVARRSVERMNADGLDYMKRVQSASAAVLVFLTEAQINAAVIEPYAQKATDTTGKNVAATIIKPAINTLRQLIKTLRTLQSADFRYVPQAVRHLMHVSNDVVLGGGGTDRVSFVLSRHARLRSEAWLDFVLSSLLSTAAEADLKKLNPFLSDARRSDLVDLAMSILVRANRVGQVSILVLLRFLLGCY